METGIDIISRDQAYLSTDDPALIRRIRRLSDENPNCVTVRKEPESNNGCWYGAIPTKWVRISPPRKVEYTEEQRAAMADRLRKLRVSSKSDADE